MMVYFYISNQKNATNHKQPMCSCTVDEEVCLAAFTIPLQAEHISKAGEASRDTAGTPQGLNNVSLFPFISLSSIFHEAPPFTSDTASARPPWKIFNIFHHWGIKKSESTLLNVHRSGEEVDAGWWWVWTGNECREPELPGTSSSGKYVRCAA